MLWQVYEKVALCVVTILITALRSCSVLSFLSVLFVCIALRYCVFFVVRVPEEKDDNALQAAYLYPFVGHMVLYYDECVGRNHELYC